MPHSPRLCALGPLGTGRLRWEDSRGRAEKTGGRLGSPAGRGEAGPAAQGPGVRRRGPPAEAGSPSPRAAAGRSDHVLAQLGAAGDEAGSERERLGGPARPGGRSCGLWVRGAAGKTRGLWRGGGSAWRGGLAGVWTERWARAPVSLAQGGPRFPSAEGPRRAAGAQEGGCV